MKCPYCKYDLVYNKSRKEWCCTLGKHKIGEKYRFSLDELNLTLKILEKTLEINFN